MAKNRKEKEKFAEQEQAAEMSALASALAISAAYQNASNLMQHGIASALQVIKAGPEFPERTKIIRMLEHALGVGASESPNEWLSGVEEMIHFNNGTPAMKGMSYPMIIDAIIEATTQAKQGPAAADPHKYPVLSVDAGFFTAVKTLFNAPELGNPNVIKLFNTIIMPHETFRVLKERMAAGSFGEQIDLTDNIIDSLRRKMLDDGEGVQ